MTLETTRQKVTEAVMLLKQGNPHMARFELESILREPGPGGGAAILACNWIDLGLAGMARTELEGYLRKTALRQGLEALR